MESEIRGNYKVWIATIYLFLVSGFLYLKPNLAFGEEGRIRPFGVGDREKTGCPLWWRMFIHAVVSYSIGMVLVKFQL
jgi:hypothetical protein